MWKRLAQRMVRELEPDAVWVIDDTGFPKQGSHSVGVERQYSGTLGKTAHCQVAVSLQEVCAEGAAVLSGRLYLPESWAQDPQRRAEAGIPEEVKFRKKWELALEMIDQARGWEWADRIIVADAGYGDGTAFREELEKRMLPYAVGVPSNTGVGREPPRLRRSDKLNPFRSALLIFSSTAGRAAVHAYELLRAEAGELSPRAVFLEFRPVCTYAIQATFPGRESVRKQNRFQNLVIIAQFM